MPHLPLCKALSYLLRRPGKHSSARHLGGGRIQTRDVPAIVSGTHGRDVRGVTKGGRPWSALGSSSSLCTLYCYSVPQLCTAVVYCCCVRLLLYQASPGALAQQRRAGGSRCAAAAHLDVAREQGRATVSWCSLVEGAQVHTCFGAVPVLLAWHAYHAACEGHTNLPSTREPLRRARKILQHDVEGKDSEGSGKHRHAKVYSLTMTEKRIPT